MVLLTGDLFQIELIVLSCNLIFKQDILTNYLLIFCLKRAIYTSNNDQFLETKREEKQKPSPLSQSRNSRRQYNGQKQNTRQKEKQWSTKHYTSK